LAAAVLPLVVRGRVQALLRVFARPLCSGSLLPLAIWNHIDSVYWSKTCNYTLGSSTCPRRVCLHSSCTIVHFLPIFPKRTAILHPSALPPKLPLRPCRHLGMRRAPRRHVGSRATRAVMFARVSEICKGGSTLLPALLVGGARCKCRLDVTWRPVVYRMGPGGLGDQGH
jgi:hypothetical protein